MTVVVSSRYFNEDQVLVDVGNGERAYAIYPEQFIANSTRYVEYIAVGGETFDNIAQEIYGDPTLWWAVARLNPHIFYPGPIPAGAYIRRPVP